MCRSKKQGWRSAASVYILDADSGEILDVRGLPEELNFETNIYNGISCINYGGKEIGAIKCKREEKIYLFDI